MGKGIFTYQTDLCTNTGHYDNKKYNAQQLEDTYKLWYQYSNYYLGTPLVFNIKDLKKARTERQQTLQKLDQDYQKASSEIKALKNINTPFWSDIKNRTLQKLTKIHELKRAEIQAYTNPSVLKQNTHSKCIKYAEALNGNDELLMGTWKKIREEMSAKNADPDRIMNDFYSFKNSNEKRDYATIDLLNFGWWNCNNNQLDPFDEYENMEKEFTKLFTKITSECDEP